MPSRVHIVRLNSGIDQDFLTWISLMRHNVDEAPRSLSCGEAMQTKVHNPDQLAKILEILDLFSRDKVSGSPAKIISKFTRQSNPCRFVRVEIW